MLWLIRVVQQKPTQHCKAIILQLKLSSKDFSSKGGGGRIWVWMDYNDEHLAFELHLWIPGLNLLIGLMLTSSRFFYLFWPPPGNTGIYISSFPCPRLRDTGSSSEKQCDCFLPHISSFLFHKLRTTVSHSMVIKVLRECKSLMSSRCSKTLVFLFFFFAILFSITIRLKFTLKIMIF